MRHLACLIFGLLLCSTAIAQDQSRRAQVSAANATAVSALRDQVLHEQLSPALTVRDLVEQTRTMSMLTKALGRAELIGGPRWIDAQTCQVRLEISGTRVAQVLNQIASADPDRAPIPPAVLSEILRDWNRKTFSATGTSAGASTIAQAEPVATDAWANVSEDARRQAIDAAHQNAVGRVIQSIQPIVLADRKTVGQTLESASVRRPVAEWLAAQPVVHVDFRDDLQVEVQMAAPAEDLYTTYRACLTQSDEAVATSSEIDWPRVHDQFVQHTVPAIGRARAGAGVPIPATRPSVVLPDAAPSWIDDQLEAKGEGRIDGSKLQGLRAAEAQAGDSLRNQIVALPLKEHLTVGQAAEKDRDLRDAISRATDHARITKIEYRPDSVTVKKSLDLADLWHELRQAR